MKYLVIACTALFIFSCQKNDSEKNLQITGTVKGLKKGTLYIQKIVDTSLIAIDTIQIDGNSAFESTLTIDSPEMYYLFLDRGVTNSLDNNLPFFAEAGKINVETSLDHFLSDVKVTGSKNHDKYAEYKNVSSRFTDRNLDLMEIKFNAYKLNNPKTIDSIEALQDTNLKKSYLYTTNFAINNKDFEVAPFLTLTEIPNINLKYLDTIQKSMAPKVAKSYYGKKLIKYYNERKQDGQ